MNIQDYIASGIIESYVLGMASANEKAEFERLCEIYPELKAAMLDFEIALERKAFANAVSPPPQLKKTVFDLIQQEAAEDDLEKIISIDAGKKAIAKKPSTMRWAIAASVALLIATGSFIYFFYQKNNELETKIAKSKQALEQIDEENKVQEYLSVPENSVIKQVNVTLPKQTVPASINVYWDSTNTHVYLVIRGLEKLPEADKYQVWSITKGKYNSLGLFDAPANDKLILKVNNSQDADAFAISIVKGKTTGITTDTVTSLPIPK